MNSILLDRILVSDDGTCWESAAELRTDGDVRDPKLCIMPDGRALCLIRGHNLIPAQLGWAEPLYRRWQWQALTENVGGLQLIQLTDGRIVVGGRHFGKQHEMRLWWLDTATGQLDPILTLPSGGDTSYPGMVEYEGMLRVSYYSSHEDKTVIYLARLAIEG